jgi:hypothetical protein
MNKLSSTLTKWRSRSKDRPTELTIDVSVAVQTMPAAKSPEFQRRAARAMGQSPVVWSG